MWKEININSEFEEYKARLLKKKSDSETTPEFTTIYQDNYFIFGIKKI